MQGPINDGLREKLWELLKFRGISVQDSMSLPEGERKKLTSEVLSDMVDEILKKG